VPWQCSKHKPCPHRHQELTIAITGQPDSASSGPRFLKLTDLAEILNISAAQAYALVRSGEIPAIKVGGRGQWRVENSTVEDAIQQMYVDTAQFVRDHPFGNNAGVEDSELD